MEFKDPKLVKLVNQFGGHIIACTEYPNRLIRAKRVLEMIGEYLGVNKDPEDSVTLSYCMGLKTMLNANAMALNLLLLTLDDTIAGVAVDRRAHYIATRIAEMLVCSNYGIVTRAVADKLDARIVELKATIVVDEAVENITQIDMFSKRGKRLLPKS